MPNAYYNEIDPYAAQWLRNLIAAGHIAPGDVDERDIRLVRPDELRGYRQCHFFAGIGVWSYALRLAGWPDDREVWTGSCPCQPFSTAGKGEGAADPRHLWPEWFRLIRERRPIRVFGEQVGASIRHGWLDLVQTDLEGLDYAVGAAVMGAHSVGAPHIRQRLFFVADARRECGAGRGDVRNMGEAQARNEGPRGERQRLRDSADDSGATGELADRWGFGRKRDTEAEELTSNTSAERSQSVPNTESCGVSGDMGDTEQQGLQEQRRQRGVPCRQERTGSGKAVIGAGASTFWSACDWLPCIDGKARPVKPGTFPLAHGAAARVGRLRAYGNAIVAPQAAEFIRAYRECTQ